MQHFTVSAIIKHKPLPLSNEFCQFCVAFDFLRETRKPLDISQSWKPEWAGHPLGCCERGNLATPRVAQFRIGILTVSDSTLWGIRSYSQHYFSPFREIPQTHLSSLISCMGEFNPTRVYNMAGRRKFKMSTANFYVIQTQGSFRNEIGEIIETELYGHLGTRLGSEPAAAGVIRELAEKGVATTGFIDSTGLENTIEITDDKYAVRAILRKATRPMNMKEISRAVSHDIGPYSRILGQLEADGELEAVAGSVQWKLERFTVVAGDSIGWGRCFMAHIDGPILSALQNLM